MALLLRYLAVLLVVGPFVAMAAEPFYSGVLSWFGIDSEDWAAPMMEALFQFFASDLFLRSSLASIGFGSGILAHWLATTTDHRYLARMGRFDLKSLRRNLDVVKYGVFNPAKKQRVEKALGRIVAYREMMGENREIQNVFDTFVQAIGKAEESSRREPSMMQLRSDGKRHIISKHELVRQMCDSMYEVCVKPEAFDPVSWEDEKGVCWMPPVYREAFPILQGAGK